ncbi:hypothetical protein ACLOJK_004704 [Asimina triloba]
MGWVLGAGTHLKLLPYFSWDRRCASARIVTGLGDGRRLLAAGAGRLRSRWIGAVDVIRRRRDVICSLAHPSSIDLSKLMDNDATDGLLLWPKLDQWDGRCHADFRCLSYRDWLGPWLRSDTMAGPCCDLGFGSTRRHLAGRAEEIAGRSMEWATLHWIVSSLAWDRWAAMEVPDGDADFGELKKKERVSPRNGCFPP